MPRPRLDGTPAKPANKRNLSDAFLRSVKPAESAQGNVVFDAPPRHYKLKLMDETGERSAYIDIPLSFGAETPEMPTPGSAVKQPAVPLRSPATPLTSAPPPKK